MITLFNPNETDFTHNGLGNLDKNIINSVVEEDLNGIFSLSFEYPIFAIHGLKIDGQSIIRAPVPEGPDQLFRVYKPIKSMGYLKVECYHVFYDLIDNFIEDTNIVSKDGQTALTQMGSKTQYGHNFRFFSDITTIASSRVVRKNPIEFLLDYSLENSFVNRWGGELKRNNFDVSMYNSIGSDKGVTIRHKKDLLGYEAVVDWHSPVTRIMPIGFDGLLLPEKYIDSPVINSYVKPKIQTIEYGDVKAAIGQYADDKEAIPLEQAYTELRRLANLEYSKGKIDYPKASYKVEFVTLSKTEEYKDYISLETVALGDTVTVIHSEDNLDIKAKVIKYRFDPLVKNYIDIELGNFKETFSDTQSKIDSIYNHVEEIKQDISLTIQVSADGKNTIYRGVATPVNARVGDLWYKPIDNGNTEMYIYTDDPILPWQLIFSTASLDNVSKEVEAVIADMAIEKERINQTIAKADQAIADAGFIKLDLIQVKQDAVNAMTEAQQATGNVNTISTKVDTLTQTMILKADNTTVNNLTGVVDRHTLDIATNAREISLKLTSAQVDSLVTGKGYATTTALTATSNTLSANITEVSTDLSNLEIGGRNLILKSDEVINTTTQYLIKSWQASIPWVVGETYTVSLKGTINAGQMFSVYFNSGTSRFGDLVYYPDFKIYKLTRKLNSIPDGSDKILQIYNMFSSGAKNAKIEWLKVEKGNKATDWSPAPEDMATVERAVAIEVNLNGLQTTVSNKADKSQITQLAGQISTKVESSTYNSKMTQLDSSINLRVTASQVDASILSDKKIKDTRGDNQPPSWYFTNYPNQEVREFKQRTTVGVTVGTDTYGIMNTNVPWSSASGGFVVQTFETGTGVFTRRGQGASWTIWEQTAEVSKLVSQINLSPSGVYIQGKNIQLDGNVAMDNAFVNRIKAIDISADRITAGTLNAANVNLINLNASSIATGTLTGAYYTLNLSSGVQTFMNPTQANGNLVMTQGQIRFEAGSQSIRVLKYTAEGLWLEPGANNVGTNKNSSIWLQGGGTGSHQYVHFRDTDNINQRITAVGREMFLFHGFGGQLRVEGYAGGSASGTIVSGRFITANDSGNYMRIFDNVIQMNEAGDKNIYLQPNGVGEVRVSRGNTNYKVVAGSFVNASSRDFKTNIDDFSRGALSLINSLDVVEYDLKTNLINGVNDRQFGFIAEDSPAIASVDGRGIDLYKTLALTFKGTQQLSDIAYDHDNRITKLEKENKLLKQKIEKLESAA